MIEGPQHIEKKMTALGVELKNNNECSLWTTE